MKQRLKLRKNANIVRSRMMSNPLTVAMMIAYIACLAYSSTQSTILFHTLADTFNGLVAITTFIIAVNTYKMNKNDLFIYMGFGLLFVGVLGFIHLYTGLPIGGMRFTNNKLVSAKFFLASRFFETITFLTAAAYLNGNLKKKNHTILFIKYFLLFVVVATSITYLNIIPNSFVSTSLTTQNLTINHILGLLNFAAAFVLFKNRNKLDKVLYGDIILMILIMTPSEIILNPALTAREGLFVCGVIIRTIGFVCIYNAVIANGLRRPFDELVYTLDKTKSSYRTQEKRAAFIEGAFLKNEQCYDMVIENSSDGIVILENSKVAYANKTAVEIAGVKEEAQLMGKNPYDYINKDFEDFVQKDIRKTIKEKRNLTPVEFRMHRLNGEDIDIELSANHIIYKGKPATLCMFRDISGKNKIVRLEKDVRDREYELYQSNELNKFQNELFNNISHELKTPLNVILSAIQLINVYVKQDCTTCNAEKQNKLLSTMKQNCFRLLRLVNNVIDISKVEVGSLTPKRKNCNIVALIEDITMSVSTYVESRSVNLIFDTDIEEKCMAVDSDLMERMMLNLLSNAIKFTEQNGVIEVSLQDKGQYVTISVSDNGVGIPSNKIEMIFDRFGQVDKTLSRNREGSGIGLSLVKSIVDMHGGDISVYSILGRGSQFVITLPVEIVAEEYVERQVSAHTNTERISIEFSDIYSYE